MRVLFAIAEMAPLAQVGGLGAVAASLPPALRRTGVDVEVVIPLYDVLRPFAGERIETVPVGDHTVDLVRGHIGEVPIVFVEHEGWFGTGPIYRSGDADAERFVGFGLAAAKAALVGGFDVFHANDWHTAAGVVALEASKPATVLTIHNLAHQGRMDSSVFGDLGLEVRGGQVNLLGDAIVSADAVTTVSPTYAEEITTPQYGEGLDGLLRDRERDVVGILNGIDIDEWDPRTDERIPAPYGPDNLAPKALAKAALRERFDLRDSAAVPIAGVVSRLVHQKGLDVLPEAVAPLIEQGRLQIVAIGTGDPTIEAALGSLADRFPADVGFFRGFDLDLAHLVEAGSDIFLMPSRFEPCGLNQMYSLRYGTVPVVRRTGGLADTVTEWDPVAKSGTGFVFDRLDRAQFGAAVTRAVDAFADTESWTTLQTNGMNVDVSWDSRTPAYREVYATASRS